MIIKKYIHLLFQTTVLMLLAATASPLLGEESTHDSLAAHDEEEEFERNVAAVFIGVTGKERRNGEPALGLEYARYFNPSFAIRGIIEYTSGDDDFWVVAVPFAYRTGPWTAYIAPGFEVEELKDRPSDSHWLLRVGGEYGFEIGKVEVAPQINVDFVEGDTVFVFGVTVGTRF